MYICVYASVAIVAREVEVTAIGTNTMNCLTPWDDEIRQQVEAVRAQWGDDWQIIHGLTRTGWGEYCCTWCGKGPMNDPFMHISTQKHLNKVHWDRPCAQFSLSSDVALVVQVHTAIPYRWSIIELKPYSCSVIYCKSHRWPNRPRVRAIDGAAISVRIWVARLCLYAICIRDLVCLTSPNNASFIAVADSALVS